MLFKVSLILPTFNNQRTIRQCLDGIFKQDYPKKYLEVLVIDGGSTDSTLEICKKYPVKILKNKWRVEEKGRVIGINSAKNEIVGFIDADNIIYDNNFLEKMVEPFDDEEIIGTDTLYFDYKKNDSLLTRYCALLSGDDPYSIYLGLNDRLCFFNNRWTGMKNKTVDKGNYLKVKIFKGSVPAMGSNGFFVRRKVFSKIKYDPFIHTDFVNRLVEKGYGTFGKSKVGLKHDLTNFGDFFKKKLRRVKRRMSGEIKLDYEYNVSKVRLLLVSLLFLTWIIPIFDAFRGFVRKRDTAWVMHPFACFGTFVIYFGYSIYYNLIGRWID